MPDKSEVARLTESYLDGHLTSEQEARLASLIGGSTEALQAFRLTVGMDYALRHHREFQAGDEAFWAGVHARICLEEEDGAFVDGVLEKISTLKAIDQALPFRPAPRVVESSSMVNRLPRPTSVILLLAACVALAAAPLYWFLGREESPLPALTAVLPDKQADVTVQRDHRILRAEPGKSLLAGDIIRVGPKAEAIIQFPDSTQLVLGADSVLTLKTTEGRAPAEVAEGTRGGRWAGEPRSPISGEQRRKAEGKWVELRQGSLMATVAKQPAGQPMIFATPTAEATVLGTRLQLRANETSTRLDVTEGAVRFRRLADDQAVTVSQGQQAVVATDSSLPLAVTSVTNNPGGGTTLYSNDMETAATYGGTLTTAQKHSGAQSEQRPASATGHFSNINKTLPAGTVASAFHRVWVFDNNHATQIYRLGITFQKPDLTAITDTAGYAAAGSDWTQLNYDVTSLVNTRKSQGYTTIKSLLLWAYNPDGYVPFYLDDVVVEYQ